MKIKFNIDIGLIDKTRCIVNSVGRALVKKKVLMFGSKEIYTINNTDIFDVCKDLYSSKKKHEEKLFKVYNQRMV